MNLQTYVSWQHAKHVAVETIWKKSYGVICVERKSRRNYSVRSDDGVKTMPLGAASRATSHLAPSAARYLIFLSRSRTSAILACFLPALAEQSDQRVRSTESRIDQYGHAVRAPASRGDRLVRLCSLAVGESLQHSL